ncbi:MAG: hypothetical protein HGA87_03315 [Desulfobulbaceae bacterium]|nr:hypothetical protein [Desulfobulbaceae bacterium]
MSDTCTWILDTDWIHENGDYCYDTECVNRWQMNEPREEHDINYCPYCGGEIKEVRGDN